jgi:hypothetical protein
MLKQWILLLFSNSDYLINYTKIDNIINKTNIYKCLKKCETLGV